MSNDFDVRSQLKESEREMRIIRWTIGLALLTGLFFTVLFFINLF